MANTVRRISLALLLALPLMLALAPGSREALGSFIMMSQEEIFARSDLVVLGRATLGETGEINRPDDHETLPYRDYGFKVQKTFKGPETLSDVTVRIPGGTRSGSTMMVTGTAEITPEMDQVLFLIKIPGEKIYSTFNPLGVFTVMNNKVSNPEETLEMSVFVSRIDEFKNKYGNGLLLKSAQQSPTAAGESDSEGIDLRKILTVAVPALVLLACAALRRKYARETGGPGPM